MHDDDFDHEHFEIGPNTIIEDIEGVEMFSLKSVGIDIGSSTSHLVFSRLTLRREGASLSGRFKVTDREVLFRSRIMLTPYLSGTLIDMDKVKHFIEEAYEEAGRTLMEASGFQVELGKKLNINQQENFAVFMAKILFEIIEQGPVSPLARDLMVTAPFTNYWGLDQIDYIVFSQRGFRACL